MKKLNRFYSDYIEKSERIDKLKEALFASAPEIEADRAVLLTESYMKTEGRADHYKACKGF